MSTYDESEKVDPPSCLDAAYERQAILNGALINKVTFPENQKYYDERIPKAHHHPLVMEKGVKYDDGKPDYSLLPPEAVEATARVFTMGASKYGRRNWEKGLSYSRVFAACMRHMWAWWRGEDKDSESGLSHLHHAACNIMMLQWYSANNKGEDDRQK